MAYTYDFPHPAVTVDVVLFTIRDDDLKALLIQRAQEPFEGSWALPGGFVGIGESLRRAAWRELREETGVHAGYIEQLHTFGCPGRDPRERVITVAYLALLPSDRLEPAAASDAKAAKLFSLKNLPDLAFDHANILRCGHERLKEKLDDSVIALQLLPVAFTHSELRRVYELVLGVMLDKRNFRKKISALDVIEATGEEKRAGPHRPAKLYRVKNPHDVPFR
ncbi:MAG: NUDIX hydrolase [Proteobacteria bacterium]|nr:NUDIX hydrolase [Pseudomonadota bacterium]